MVLKNNFTLGYEGWGLNPDTTTSRFVILSNNLLRLISHLSNGDNNGGCLTG